jgi:threonine/homoserine/homoserine lactone efflux protein
MPEAPTIILFLVAAMVLFVVPGPVVIYVVTRSVTQGTRAGLVSVAGVHLGSMVHVAAAAAGLSAIVATSASVFTAVKLVGAAYLVYLGLRTLFGRGESVSAAGEGAPRTLRRVFWQGVLVNVLNPKTAVFFLAFVPQFVDQARGSATAQIIVLGTLFVAAGVLSDGAYAVVAGTLGHRLLARPAIARVQRWVAGSIYIGLGAAAALSGRPAEAVGGAGR